MFSFFSGTLKSRYSNCTSITCQQSIIMIFFLPHKDPAIFPPPVWPLPPVHFTTFPPSLFKGQASICLLPRPSAQSENKIQTNAVFLSHICHLNRKSLSDPLSKRQIYSKVQVQQLYAAHPHRLSEQSTSYGFCNPSRPALWDCPVTLPATPRLQGSNGLCICSFM